MGYRGFSGLTAHPRSPGPPEAPGHPMRDLVIDPVLMRNYDLDGPRYASYPTADRFVEAFGESELRHWLARRNIGGISQPLSVYVHLPASSSKYIKYLEKELALLAPLLGSDRATCQVHWGGATPTPPTREEMAALMASLRTHFALEGAECSIECDPRRMAPGTLGFLGTQGFIRVSIGLQEATCAAVAEARASGFRSVGLKLAYGLPKQTLDGFNRTLDRAIALDPDRIALCSYAHLPKRALSQRCRAQADLPSAEARLQILTLALGRLARAGYVYIGMDHFARPDDELALAQAQGRLQRDFQGYSTHGGADTIGLGVAAICRVGPTYCQNFRQLGHYYGFLDEGRLPVARGVELTTDDLVRRAIIQALVCQFRVSIESIELAYLIDFRSYFAQEWKDLQRQEGEGLVELHRDWIVVSSRGRLVVHVICMVFDRYLRLRRERASYTKVM